MSIAIGGRVSKNVPNWTLTCPFFNPIYVFTKALVLLLTHIFFGTTFPVLPRYECVFSGSLRCEFISATSIWVLPSKKRREIMYLSRSFKCSMAACSDRAFDPFSSLFMRSLVWLSRQSASPPSLYTGSWRLMERLNGALAHR